MWRPPCPPSSSLASPVWSISIVDAEGARNTSDTTDASGANPATNTLGFTSARAAKDALVAIDATVAMVADIGCRSRAVGRESAGFCGAHGSSVERVQHLRCDTDAAGGPYARACSNIIFNGEADAAHVQLIVSLRRSEAHLLKTAK